MSRTERGGDLFLDWFERVFFSRGFDRLCNALLVLIGAWLVSFILRGVL